MLNTKVMHWIPEIRFANVLIQLQMLNDNSRLEQMYLNLFWTYYYLVFSSKMMDDNAVSCGQFGKKDYLPWNGILLLVTVQKIFYCTSLHSTVSE